MYDIRRDRGPYYSLAPDVDVVVGKPSKVLHVGYINYCAILKTAHFADDIDLGWLLLRPLKKTLQFLLFDLKNLNIMFIDSCGICSTAALLKAATCNTARSKNICPVIPTEGSNEEMFSGNVRFLQKNSDYTLDG